MEPTVPPAGTPPRPPSLLRRAAAFYGIVALFAVGFATFSEKLGVLFGEKPLEWKGVLAALGIGLALVGLTRLGARAWKPMGRAARAGAAMLGPLTMGEVLGLALLSGFAEELLFRGALWPTLTLWGTTLLFGLVHVVPRLDLWVWPLFATLAGLAMGLVREGSGHLLPSILVHVLVNGFNLAWLSRFAAHPPAPAAPPPVPGPGAPTPGPDAPPAPPPGPPA
jgi:membrane protease YdiL (CAAX protease family)